MIELFEVIKAVNRLGDKITDVSGKVDTLIEAVSQSPSRELAASYVDELTASAIIKKCPRSLRDCRRKGELSFMRVGKKVLYKISDLKSFLEKNYL
jgi:enoyl-[acyl-carrier-protein] reductase (NADH)